MAEIRAKDPTACDQASTRGQAPADRKPSAEDTPSGEAAAETAAEAAVRQSVDQGMRRVEVMVSGPGSGRETALRAIQATGVGISLIRDVTPVPHNGCRPPKKRRV